VKTLVIFDRNTKDVIACIPEQGEAICMKGVGISLYDGTEPIFLETENGIKVSENSFMLNMGGIGE
jgi:hypothetical protein